MPRLVYLENRASTFRSHRLKQARHLLARGFEVHCMCPRGEPAVVAALARQGIWVHTFWFDRGFGGLVGALRSLRGLVRGFRAIRPDIVHGFTPKLGLLGGLASRIAGVPAVVVTVTGLGYGFSGGGPKRFAVRQVLRVGLPVALGHRNSWVLAQNRDDLAWLMRTGMARRAQVRLVRGSGVDTHRFTVQPLPQGPPVILLASRMLADKGVREYAQAARLVRQAHPQAQFVLVGGVDPGNPASLTQAELRALEARGVVRWWGHRTDMPQVLSQCTVFCLPSHREGLPQVALEAMATGRPLVTTDTTGCRELVPGPEHGWLVPPRDPDSLAQALCEALAHPERWPAMATANRNLVEREFSLQRVVDQTLAIYREALGGCTPCQ